jgi:chromosomal replication initiation ATPase DnaA
MTQLSLPLAYVHSKDAADFFISDCNCKAVTWLEYFPNWGHHASLLLGPAGSGKSHLAAMFKAHHGTKVMVFDQSINADDEVALFHSYNNAKETNTGLLIVQRDAPVHIRLPDLASRLAEAPVVRIEAPDDAVLSAVMIKAARDRGLNLAPEIIAYALKRLERQFSVVHSFIAQLDITSLAQKRDVTVPLASQILQTLSSS